MLFIGEAGRTKRIDHSFFAVSSCSPTKTHNPAKLLHKHAFHVFHVGRIDDLFKQSNLPIPINGLHSLFKLLSGYGRHVYYS